MAKKNYYIVKSFEKGLKVIELLAQNDDMSVTELAKHLKTDTSSSHRFLSTLRELGYAEKNKDGRYKLTFKILEYGMKVADRFEIRRIARPFMQILSKKYGQNINLAYFDGERVVQIDQIPSRDIFRIDPGIGAEIPAYATGLGKVIMAFLPDSERDRLLECFELKPFGPKTKTSKELLKTEILEVQKQGYAIDDEELALGLRCVAAPVFDVDKRPIYAISISGPTFYMKKERFEEMGEDLKVNCHKLSRIVATSVRIAV